MRTRNKAQWATVWIACLLAFACSGCSRKAKQARYVEAGRRLLENKDYKRAFLQFRNAVQMDSGEADPYYQLGLTYLAMGDASSALSQFLKAGELNPNHIAAHLKTAELLATSPDREIVRQAQERARAVLSASPENPDALNTLAVTELKLGNREEAIRRLESAIRKSPKNLRSSITLALVKLEQHDTAAAEEILTKGLQQHPELAEAAIALASFRLLNGKAEQAERELRTVIERDPKNALALATLAHIQMAANRKQEAEQTYRRLSVLPNKKYEHLYAIFLFQNGKQDAAIAEFERLAKEDPKDLDTRTRLVSAYVATDRLGDADKLLARVLKKNVKDDSALLQRGELFLIAGLNDEAQNLLNQVVRSQRDSVGAHFLLGKVYQAQGSPLSERQQFAEALRLNPAFLPARTGLAQSLVTGGSARAALDLMNQTPEAQKHTIEYLIARNWALLASNDQAEVRKGIDQGLALKRARALLMQDALLKFSQQNYAGARIPLQEVLRQNPEDLGAVVVLARTYVAQKQIPTAIQKVQEYVAERPHSAPLQNFLGNLLVSAGQNGPARLAFSAAKAADPKFAPPYLALAHLDRHEGKMDDARRMLTPLLSFKQSELAAHLHLGYLEAKSGNYPKAIEHCRKVVETDPSNVAALNNLAYLLAEYANQPDEALKYAQRAAELASDNVAVEGTVGWAYYRKGIYNTALKYLEKAVSTEGTVVQEGSVIRKYHLAMAYLKNGERERGLKVLETALKSDPNLPEAQMAQEVMLEK